MLVIRFFRQGKKNQPFYKIVVTEKTRPPRAGRFVEEVGFYNPKTKEKGLKGERIKYWISVGAQPSDTVYNLLISEKIIEGKKRPQHKKSKKEKPAEEKPAETPVAPELAKPEEVKTEEKPVEVPVPAAEPSAPTEEVKPEEKPVEPPPAV